MTFVQALQGVSASLHDFGVQPSTLTISLPRNEYARLCDGLAIEMGYLLMPDIRDRMMKGEFHLLGIKFVMGK